MKLKRGQKLCKKCKQINAARQRICKWCDHEFVLTNKKIKGEITNWKDLKRGDIFRVVNGTGPYYVLKRDCGEGKKGERLPVGVRGVYSVHDVAENGLHCYGSSNKNSGFAFVYMGKKEFCEDTSTYRRPHRLVASSSKRRK